MKNGNFAIWPSLTEKNIIKFLSKSEAAALGHMDPVHKNTHSTIIIAHTYARKEDVEVLPIEHQERKKYIFAEMRDTVTGRIANDQTGEFPVFSGQGNCCVFILYHYDSNAILLEPMKSRKDGVILRVYSKSFLHLYKRGL